MKKIVILLFATTLFAWSCNEGNHNPASSEVTITHKEVNAEVIKTVANLSISGMTCSGGCGGKIQQELRALNGVASTDLDYADARPVNVVSVEYDPEKLSEVELIKCVNGISDGQYQVTTVEIVNYKGLQSAGRTGGSDVTATENFGKVFQLLNLLESVSKLIH